jgi:membrane peptidoglycan carboxypeptidase
VWHALHDYGKVNVIKPPIAYEVHSCLVDALDRGTGKAARTQLGLKKMDAGGKTGTAYDFTDALFAGYDSAITCAVWAGFDKPQQIFRGAFGREIALPVWVDVMNASAARYPPKEIQPPRGLEQVNICATSGLLATDKCVEKIKTAEGQTEQKTTYLEWATPAQKPTETCNIHGELRASLTRDLPVSEFPRAALAVDTSAVKPVTPKEPTLLASRDPYNSVHAMANPKPSPSPSPEAEKEKTSEEMPDPTKPVLKAIAVQPGEGETSEASASPVPSETVTRAIKPTGTPVEIRRAVPVTKPSPQVTQPEVRRARPVDEDESD